MSKPCQRGEQCVWAKRNGKNVTCMWRFCQLEDPEEEEERGFREMKRLMESHDTFGRRNGRVIQRRRGR